LFAGDGPGSAAFLVLNQLFMKGQKLFSSRVFWLVGGFIALAILYIFLSPVIKDERPMAPGMTGTVGLRGERTLTPTGEDTLTPTELEQSRKTAGAAAMETYRALYRLDKITPPPTCCPPTNTLAPFVPGINEMSYAPDIVPQSVVISSQWRNLVNGQRTYVYAGAHRDTTGATPDTRQGLIIVEVYSADLSNYLTSLYDAPGSTGILRITSATGYRLTLAGQNGETLYFDVLTGQYVDRLNTTVTAPTITPLPPRTATATPTTSTWLTEYPAPPVIYPPEIYPPPGTPVRIP